MPASPAPEREAKRPRSLGLDAAPTRGALRRDIVTMLRIPTYVAPSAIAGVGLFSASDLDAGTIIWEYSEGVDWRLTPEELAAIPESFQGWLSHYLYLDESGLYVLCGDNAKYMNHHDDPNCDDSGDTFTVTRRAVRAGEELTCDYTLFDQDSKRNGVTFAATPA